MSENFEKLKRISIQKIHETTHIPRVHIESILNENFENMSKIQLLGFIYVLEREYSLDLSQLKVKTEEYFAKNRATEKKTNSATLLISSKKKRNFTFVYILFAIAIFIAFAFYNTQSKDSESTKVDNSAITNAQNNISVAMEDKKISKADENITQNLQLSQEPTVAQQESVQNPVEPIVQKDISKNELEPIEESPKAEVVTIDVDTTKSKEIVKEMMPSVEKEVNESKESATVVASLKIISKSKVWLGYIDMSNRRQNQKTFSGEFTLDPSRNWLISLGHGFIDVEINGVTTSFKKAQNIRFSYIDSKLKEIDAEEFKSLNRGTTW